jgi:hypothetical protein
MAQGLNKRIQRRELLALGASALAPAFLPVPLYCDEVTVEAQPFCAQIRRIIDAMEYLGSPFGSGDLAALRAAVAHPGGIGTVGTIQRLIDAYVLVNITINPEGRVSTTRGAARPELIQNGWRVFLIKVANEAGTTARLRAECDQALPDSGQSPGSRVTPTGVAQPGASRPVQAITPEDVIDRWLDLEMFDAPPLAPSLSGLRVEYRIIQLYSRDPGKKEAVLAFNAGPATEDIGFRSSVPIVFACQPASAARFRIRDADGSPVTCSIIITDRQGRVYPSRAKRLAPDFPFQTQIYRSDGESVLLPQGEYTIEFARGPEYIAKRQTIQMRSDHNPIELQLDRWIDPGQFGWFPGDHHIHAAGCKHYNTPTQGVLPNAIAPQLRGEGLSFGEILSWAPCWYYQKQFFSGHIDPMSTKESVLRYDVEVSGFPSSYWGHLVLLQLREENYPGTQELEQWPTWSLPILKWAKSQNAVTGFAHSGHGLVVDSSDLPNYLIPPFDDNGANEFLIDAAHGAVDFLSAADTPALAELNLWYHTLNCGFRIPIAGETDFPCLFEKVGIGRTYVHLEKMPSGESGYRDWIDGLKSGRSYVSDGRSHFLDVSVSGQRPGDPPHEIRLQRPSMVRINARVAAYLSPQPGPEEAAVRSKSWNKSPFWQIERARIGDSRSVLVELIINGKVLASKKIEANGEVQEIEFNPTIDRSSWIALRILPSGHSNPVFVTVAGKSIRPWRKSAQWCMDCIDAAWKSHGPRIAAQDQAIAKEAVETARNLFQRILGESDS